MPIDWIYGLLGGLMIGGAAALFLLFNGRIMGASGILGGLVDGSGSSTAMERIAFILGLIAVPGIIAMLSGGSATNVTGSLPVLVVGGLLVGLGTRIANGCTSGHGVCGISRLSSRGIIATLVYIGAGAVALLVFRHVIGWV